MLLTVVVSKCASPPPPKVVKPAPVVHTVMDQSGNVGWHIYDAYKPIQAKCGDSLVFTWGVYENHDVTVMPLDPPPFFRECMVGGRSCSDLVVWNFIQCSKLAALWS